MRSPANDAAAHGWFVPDWPAPARVRAAVTTRSLPGVSVAPFDRANLGSRCGDDPAAVVMNRASLRDWLALPAPPCWLQQVHGVDVATVDAPPEPAAPEPIADAAITRVPGVVLAVLTADCLPLLVCADDGGEVAAVHAGWRGLHAGVIEATLRAMRTPPSRCLVWLGPAIGAPSYEVGDEVRAAFVDHEAAAASAFAPARPGHWLCDLYALARQRLAAVGVRSISGGDADTFADARFYSHRRDRVTGRMASLMWIEGGQRR